MDFDQLAIQSFLSDPIGFLSNIIFDPLGNIDLSTPLPYGELSTLEALSNLISGSQILDDPLDPRHGPTII